MSSVDRSQAVEMSSAAELDAWLAANGARERELLVAIYKKSSGKQTVTLAELQETALRHGWIDNLGVRLDGERWAIRFVPRRPGSSWSELNRCRARRLLAEGQMTDAGRATLPDDL